MKNNIIHIGANKTASTTLQRALFANHTGLHYLGEDGNGYHNYKDIVNSMVLDDDLYYQEAQCVKLFKDALSKKTDKTFIYSNEDVMTSNIPTLCAKRLKGLMPDAKVLLVIRNQFTAIPSMYVNHGAFLKPAPPSYYRKHVGFSDWMQSEMMFIKYGHLASFFYSKLISVYEDLFGMNNIHILMFEDFIYNKEQFIRDLSAILDIDYNESMSLIHKRHERRRITKRMLNYNRFRTSFFWNKQFLKYIPGGNSIDEMFQRYLQSGASATPNISGVWHDNIHQLYAKDNTALKERYNLPLEKYDYPII